VEEAQLDIDESLEPSSPRLRPLDHLNELRYGSVPTNLDFSPANNDDSAEKSAEVAETSGDESAASSSSRLSPLTKLQRKRVCFDERSSRSLPTKLTKPNRSADHEVEKHLRCPVPMLKSYQILWSCIRIAGIHFIRKADGGKCRVPAELNTTRVELHCRSSRPALLQEARVMLESRHPNVLFMLGFSLDAGPLLVTEPAWGSVADALCSGHLALASAISVASQIISAVDFLHRNWIKHGAIEIGTVLLLEKPEADRVTAKLANFDQAKLNTRDQSELAADIRGFGAFAYNLFVMKRGECAVLDDLRSAEQLSKFAFGLLDLGIEFELAEVAILVQCIFTRKLISSKEVAKRFAEIQLQRSIFSEASFLPFESLADEQFIELPELLEPQEQAELAALADLTDTPELPELPERAVAKPTALRARHRFSEAPTERELDFTFEPASDCDN
jgi:hypothetical protein